MNNFEINLIEIEGDFDRIKRDLERFQIRFNEIDQTKAKNATFDLQIPRTPGNFKKIKFSVSNSTSFANLNVCRVKPHFVYVKNQLR